MTKPTSVYLNIGEFAWQVSKVLRKNPEDVVEWLENFCEALTTDKRGLSELADNLLEETDKFRKKDRDRKKPIAEQAQIKIEPQAPKETKPKAERKPKVIKEFIAPTLEDALAYGREYHKTNPNFTSLDPVRAWFENRKNADWCNAYGKPIVNWKNDLITWILRDIKNEQRSL